MGEWLPIVDTDGREIGLARRADVHSDRSLLHPVVHCVIVPERRTLLLQRRSRDKDTHPGLWDTSVGGHVGVGESTRAAAARELEEEVGLRVAPSELSFLHRYLFAGATESELVTTYLLRHSGPFVAQASEIDELQLWSVERVRNALGTGAFTPNFEEQYRRLPELE